MREFVSASRRFTMPEVSVFQLGLAIGVRFAEPGLRY